MEAYITSILPPRSLSSSPLSLSLSLSLSPLFFFLFIYQSTDVPVYLTHTLVIFFILFYLSLFLLVTYIAATNFFHSPLSNKQALFSNHQDIIPRR